MDAICCYAESWTRRWYATAHTAQRPFLELQVTVFDHTFGHFHTVPDLCDAKDNFMRSPADLVGEHHWIVPALRLFRNAAASPQSNKQASCVDFIQTSSDLLVEGTH